MFLESEEPDVDEEIVRSALANDCDRRILALAQEGPVSAQAIMRQTSIPKSTLYRRIDRLQRQGLLVVATSTIERGHRIDRYVCPLSELAIRVEDGRVRVEWTTAGAERTPSAEA